MGEAVAHTLSEAVYKVQLDAEKDIARLPVEKPRAKGDGVISVAVRTKQQKPHRSLPDPRSPAPPIEWITLPRLPLKQNPLAHETFTTASWPHRLSPSDWPECMPWGKGCRFVRSGHGLRKQQQ
ncbi:MAG: hypothetical protein Q9159_007425 [Coniocarpon cinnabarinum]